jgi:4-hydroxybenzoate polyprenyltransferase
MPLAFTYPLMKRFTYWPQLFLGITFNYGLILGWTAINAEINFIPLIFYFGAIFWTLGYDTIYGFQDIKDDEIIGLKSTSIKFKSNPYVFLIICYSTFFLILLITGYLMELNKYYFISAIFIFFHLFINQIKKLNIKKPTNCLKVFKSNNTLGLIVFVSILIGKI